MEPFKADWGAVTPEGYDRNQNQAFYVYNFYMQGPESRDLSQIFLVGKLIWSHQHLPAGCSYRVRIDLGGQSVSVNTLNKWRRDALSKIQVKVPSIQVEIEFLV